MLSKSTEDHDREEKMPIFAREGVRHAWLVDPITKTLEVDTLDANGRWSAPVISRDAEIVRAVHFDAIDLDLSILWT